MVTGLLCSQSSCGASKGRSLCAILSASAPARGKKDFTSFPACEGSGLLERKASLVHFQQVLYLRANIRVARRALSFVERRWIESQPLPPSLRHPAIRKR